MVPQGLLEQQVETRLQGTTKLCTALQCVAYTTADKRL